jgi:hypothetical protein
LRPNPANHYLDIQTVGLEPNQPTKVFIISAGGVMVKSFQLYTATNSFKIDLSTLKKGMYSVTLKNGNNVFTKQFLKL